MTDIERINPYLNVSDLKHSMAYYREVLGFSLVAETERLIIVSLGDHEIHLRLAEGEVLPNRVWLGAGDILPFYDIYKENGAVFLEVPTNYPWAYQMIVADTDGNLLIYGSAPIES